MAEQATGAVESTGAEGTLAHGGSTHEEHNPGKPMSWVGVAIVIIGFVIGGIAMVPAPHWTIFWIGTGVAIVGCFTLVFTKTMNEDWY